MNRQSLIIALLIASAFLPAQCQTLKGGAEKDDIIQQQLLDGQTQQPLIQGQTNQPEFKLGEQLIYKGNGTFERQPLQQQVPQEQHGQDWYGVLGARVDNETGVIVTVFPESDLNRFGVRSGDRVLAVNNQPFEVEMFINECRGQTGTPIDITISSVGRINPLRVDSRFLSRHAQYYKEWARPINQW